MVKSPTDDIRDITMGRFMNAWSRLENTLFHLFWVLIGTDVLIAKAIYSTGIQTTNLSDLLIAIGQIRRIKKPEQDKLKSLVKRYRNAAGKRNKIVHGTWTAEIKDFSIDGHFIRVEVDNFQWARTYSPINLDKLYDKKSQKILRTYRFTIPQLAEATEYINALRSEFNDFRVLVESYLRSQIQPCPQESP